MVLRITRDERSAAGVTLRLDGRLVDPWADLVEHECAAAIRTHRAVIVDLSGVAILDRTGVEALRRLDRAGVAIRGCSDVVASILAADGIRAERAAD